MRTARTDGTTAYGYTYNGCQLTQMTVGSDTLTFTYDAIGNPQTVTYGGTTYYYATNLQGDVIAILNSAGTKVVSYTYDAWGNSINIAHSMASTLGTLNPLRYRGYVYDHETGLYYLQSRYYNPKVGRFINADAFTSTGQGLLGNNMFAYCGNNPVNRADYSGEFFFTILGAAIGAISGAIDSYLMGEDVWLGALAGAVSGGISGAGVDIGVVITASTGGTGIGVGLGVAYAFGAAGSAIGTGISSNWEAEPMEYVVSAFVGGGINMVSFGLAPVNGEMTKGPAKYMLKRLFQEGVLDLANNVATGAILAAGATWITRAATHNGRSTTRTAIS